MVLGRKPPLRPPPACLCVTAHGALSPHGLLRGPHHRPPPRKPPRPTHRRERGDAPESGRELGSPGSWSRAPMSQGCPCAKGRGQRDRGARRSRRPASAAFSRILVTSLSHLKWGFPVLVLMASGAGNCGDGPGSRRRLRSSPGNDRDQLPRKDLCRTAASLQVTSELCSGEAGMASPALVLGATLPGPGRPSISPPRR